MKYKIGFTCGSFDLLHAGHVLMLEEAKSICEHLIVGLQNDPTIDRPHKNKPVQSIVERQIQLSALKYVDDVIIYNTEKDLLDLLVTLPIEVRVIGEDYRGKSFTGDQLCKENGIQIYYNARQHKFSSTDVRQRVYEAEVADRFTISIHNTDAPSAVNLDNMHSQPWHGVGAGADVIFFETDEKITPDRC